MAKPAELLALNVIKYILFLISVTAHLGCVGGGVQLRFGEMGSYPKSEYCVEVSQRLHSLHQCVPKEIRFTDFG
jgi:hypothetical protein